MSSALVSSSRSWRGQVHLTRLITLNSRQFRSFSGLNWADCHLLYLNWKANLCSNVGFFFFFKVQQLLCEWRSVSGLQSVEHALFRLLAIKCYCTLRFCHVISLIANYQFSQDVSFLTRDFTQKETLQTLHTYRIIIFINTRITHIGQYIRHVHKIILLT